MNIKLKSLSLYLALACVISGYIGATLHSVFLVTGLIIWLIAIARRELPLYNPKLRILNILFLVHAITALTSTAIAEVNLLGALKSIISTYIQWFWISSSLCAHKGAPRSTQEPPRYTPIVDSAKTSHKAPFCYPERSEGSPDHCAKILATGGGLFGTIIILQVLGLIASPEPGIYGIQKQPFTSSALLLFALFTTLYCLENAERSAWFNLRRTYFIAFVIELFALFSLGQRSTVIGTVAGLLIYLVFSKALNLRGKLLSLVTISLGLASAMAVAERFRRKFAKLLEPSSLLGTNSMQCRLELWQQNLQAWALNKSNSLWLGLGEVIPYLCMDTKLTHMHNIFLQQLVRKGIVGFSTWLAFYLWSFVELIKRKSSVAFIAAFIAISIEGCFENWWGDAEVLSGFLMILALGLSVRHREAT